MNRHACALSLLVPLFCACASVDTAPAAPADPILDEAGPGTGGTSAAPADSGAGGSGAAANGGLEGDANAGSPSGVQVFLLFGQSNMEGVPPPEAEDLVENPRVEVLGYTTCGARQYNEWYTASPPLHSCYLGVGPGDAFGKALAEAWPEATIALVPAAISGVDIDFYRKGVVSARRSEFTIPPDNSREGAYDMLLEKAQLAQQRGPIRGILFHQGESDSGQSAWLNKVAEIVADLRTDLGLGESVPFIAGELLYTGCCSSHNTLVNQLPNLIPNAHVVSAEGLAGVDQFHFDLAGQRELGRRYATALLDALASP